MENTISYIKRNAPSNKRFELTALGCQEFCMRKIHASSPIALLLRRRALGPCSQFNRALNGLYMYGRKRNENERNSRFSQAVFVSGK
jgi:hypothetical protein